MEPKKTSEASLNNKRFLFAEIGGALSLLAVLVAFESKSAKGQSPILPDQLAVIVEEDDVIPIPLETPPAMPKVAIPVLDEIMIVDDCVTVDDILIETEDAPEAGVNIRDYEMETENKEVEEEEFPLVLVEEKPTFMGGDANSFSNWVMSNIVYPEICIQNNVSGRVMLQFTIDRHGKLGNIKVLREIDPALAKEAVRVVSMSPKWEPGRQRGRAVNVSYTFPVQFSLR